MSGIALFLGLYGASAVLWATFKNKIPTFVGGLLMMVVAYILTFGQKA